MTTIETLEHYISVLRKENKPSDDLRIKDFQRTIEALREKDGALVMADCYIEYLKHHDIELHKEADGTPSIHVSILKALTL